MMIKGFFWQLTSVGSALFICCWSCVYF